MNITVEDAGSCLKKISVDIPADEVNKKLSEDYRELAKQVRLPGFRPGKAPRALLEKKYGKHVTSQVRETLVQDALSEASREHDLEFVSQPDQEEANSIPEIEKGKGLAFELTIEVKPEFDLPDYKGLEISRQPVTVSEKEVDIFLRNIQFSQGEMNDLTEDQKTEKGDVVVGDFAIFVDEERIAGRPGSSLEVGSDTILGIDLPDAVDAFEGLTTAEYGETKSFNVTIPEDFPLIKHIGKEARIDVTIKQLVRPDCPEMSDEMAKELGFDDLAGLRDHAKEVIEKEKEHQANADLESRLVDSVVDATELSIPQKLADRMLSDVLSKEAFKLYQEGMEDDDIEKFIEQRREELPSSIERHIKEGFVIDEIAKKERVFVTEEEIIRYVSAIASSRGVDAQTLLDHFVNERMLPSIRQDLRSQKVRALIKKKAKIEIIGEDSTASGSDESEEKSED